jgi:hypothetical protein
MTLVDGVMIYLWFVIARSDSDEAIQTRIQTWIASLRSQ